MTMRLSINLPDDSEAALRKAAEQEGRSLTEVVRRALSIYDFLMGETRNGSTVRVVRPNGERGAVTFL